MVCKTEITLPDPELPKGKGLITYTDLLLKTDHFDWIKEDFDVDNSAKHVWIKLKHVLDHIRGLITDVRDYPMAEHYTVVSESYDEETRRTETIATEPSSPFRDRSRTINALYAIQEIAAAHELIKKIQNALLIDSLENLIYSLGLDFSMSYIPNRDSLTAIKEPWECALYAYENYPMAEGYKRIFSFLEEKESFASLKSFFEDIYKLAADAYYLFHEIASDTSARLQQLNTMSVAKHKNADLILDLLNDRISHVLSIKENHVRKQIKNGIRCGEYTIDDKLKECYQRMNECMLFKHMDAKYEETSEGFAAFIVSFISQESDFSWYSHYDDVWEFLSCVIELELLKSIKSGKSLPNPFFPIAEKSVKVQINNNNLLQNSENKTDIKPCKLDKFILGTGDEKKSNKEKFCQGIKKRQDNAAKAKYVAQQIDKTISTWPSFPALKEEGLLMCAASTWSEQVKCYK